MMERSAEIEALVEDVTIHHGDCLRVLHDMADNSVDAVVTDPPYGLEFMGKGWDAPWQERGINADAAFSTVGMSDGFERLPRPSFTGSTNPTCRKCKGRQRGRRDGTALVKTCMCTEPDFPNVRAIEMRAFQEWCEAWAVEALRVLKPGGHMLAFGGPRTWHRLAAAIEDAGFEIRDSIAWLYGSGFPKSLNLVDDEGDRTGWGTALKPAHEPIVVARKPLTSTVAANVATHGTGALNIDACRIEGDVPATQGGVTSGGIMSGSTGERRAPFVPSTGGRWPTNVVMDESRAAALDEQTGTLTSGYMKPETDRSTRQGHAYGVLSARTATATYGDSGGASRFFYVAKAAKSERPVVDGVAHPTVKPLALMRWLIRLVTPPGGTVLEPFAGSGTTVEAAMMEGFNVIGIERDESYLPLIESRIARQRAAAARPPEAALFDLADVTNPPGQTP